MRIIVCAVMMFCLAMASPFSLAFAEASTEAPSGNPANEVTDDAVNTALANNDIAEGESEQHTLVIAMAPLIDRTGGWMSRGLGTALMSRMDDELHVPLNDTMHWVTVMNEDDVETALADVSKRLGCKASMKDVMKDVMKELATELHADLTLCLVVNTCYEREFLSWDWDRDMLVESVADLTLYGYDAKNDRPIKEHASRWERDEYHPSLAVEQLMMEALDEALRNANIKSVIFPLDREKINAGKEAKEKADGKDSTDSGKSKESKSSDDVKTSAEG